MPREMDPGGANSLTNGQVVFERYRLKSLLGKGATGVVWRAHDQQLEIDIALKFLGPEFLFDESALADLKQETRSGMALAHPHILRIYGFFQDAEHAAIAMEFVEGNTLAALLAARRPRCFEPDEIAAWTRQLCNALLYAHTDAHLVHRDLKPANLMIDDRGRLKIADFGIAASVANAKTRLGTNTSGTPGYMSPQQLLGQSPDVSHDIYSLGATLYELLSGRPPFHSGDVSLQVRTVVPAPIEERRAINGFSGRTIPTEWEETIAACLAKDASLRPPNAGVVAERLGVGSAGADTLHGIGAGLSTGGASPVAPTIVDRQSASERQRRLTRRYAAFGALAILAIGGLVALSLGFGRQQGTSEENAADTTASVQQGQRGRGGFGPPPGARGAGRGGLPPRGGGFGGRGAHRWDLPFPALEVLDHPEPEHPFIIPELGIELGWIPTGENGIGAPIMALDDVRPNEQPNTRYLVNEGFWLGRYEVSGNEYTSVTAKPDPSVPKIDGNFPVNNVSWFEAMEFCRLLTQRERDAGRIPEGWEYSLPDEFQWEYAAKSSGGGPRGEFQDLTAAAWGAWTNVDSPQERGQLAATTAGIQDIFGNVAEWCYDWYEEHHPGGDVTRYWGPETGTERVVKNGSFANTVREMNSESRRGLDPAERDPHVGFRLALVRTRTGE